MRFLQTARQPAYICSPAAPQEERTDDTGPAPSKTSRPGGTAASFDLVDFDMASAPATQNIKTMRQGSVMPDSGTVYVEASCNQSEVEMEQQALITSDVTSAQRHTQVGPVSTVKMGTLTHPRILDSPRSPSECLDDQMWPLPPELPSAEAAKTDLKGMERHVLLTHLMQTENEVLGAGEEATEEHAMRQLDLPCDPINVGRVQTTENRNLLMPLEVGGEQIAAAGESHTLLLSESDDDWTGTVANQEENACQEEDKAEMQPEESTAQGTSTIGNLEVPLGSTDSENPRTGPSGGEQTVPLKKPILLQRGGVPSIPPRYFHREVTEAIIQTWLTAKPSSGQYPRVLVVGMGGLGKTATAVGAAHKIEVLDRFAACIIWTFVGALGQTEMERVAWLQELYMKVVVFLGNRVDRLFGGEEFVHSASEELFLNRINDLLVGRRCLLIFDDVQMAAMMAVILKLKCALLITARSLPTEIELFHCKVVPMRALTAGESHQLMVKIVGSESSGLHDLEVGCSGHPFALSLAGSLYCQKLMNATNVAGSTSFRDLLYKLKESSGGLITSVSPSEVIDPEDEPRYAALTRHLDAAVDCLQKHERELYIMFAVLPYGQYAPVGMLQSLWGLSGLEETCAVLETMASLSIVHCEDSRDSFKSSWWGIHGLQLDHVRGLVLSQGMQELIDVAKQRQLAYLSQLETFALLVRTVGMLKLIAFWGQVASPSVVSANYLNAVQRKWQDFEANPGDTDANLSCLLEMKIKKRNRFRMHKGPDTATKTGLASTPETEAQDCSDTDGHVLMKLGSFLEIIEEYDAAKLIFSHALCVMEDSQPDNYPQIAVAFNAVGRILEGEKNFELAQGFYRRSYNMYKGLCSKNHPEVVALLSCLGGVLKSQGSFEEAETVYMQAIEVRSQNLGGNHPDVATSLNDLAMVLSNQGRFDEAAVHHRKALDIRKSVFGMGHPSVAVSLSNLAVVLRTQGNFHEAEALHRQALKIKEQLFGGDHPETAVSLNNLGVVLSDQGQFQKAESMHRKAIDILSATFGEDHPDVAVSLNNLALVMRKSHKNMEEVESLHWKDLDISMRAYGEDHQNVALSLNNLALVLSDQGKLQEAKALHHRALEIRKRVFGEEHPCVAVSLSNLAGVLEKQGDLREAEKLHRRDLDISRKTLGDEHPSVACSMNNLAEVLRMQGNFEEAAELHRKDLEISTKVYGDEHPSVAISLNNLAGVLRDQGSLTEAEELYHRALQIKLNVYGEGHPEVAITLKSLAALQKELGNLEEAEILTRKSLQVRDALQARDAVHDAHRAQIASSLKKLELMLSAEHSSRLQRSFVGKVFSSFGLCLGKSSHGKADSPMRGSTQNPAGSPEGRLQS